MHSHIGYGAPHRQDTPSAHGEPLGAEEVRLTKEFFGFDPDQTFVVPESVRAHFNANIGTRGAELCKAFPGGRQVQGKTRLVDRSAGQTAPGALRRQPTSRPIGV